MSFTDTGFVVRLLSEEDQSYYTIRVLELQNIKVSIGARLTDSITIVESGMAEHYVSSSGKLQPVTKMSSFHYLQLQVLYIK